MLFFSMSVGIFEYCMVSLFQNELLSLREVPSVQEVVNSHGQLLLDRIMRVRTSTLIEPRYEKTGLRGFRPGPTQTGLQNIKR